MKHRIGYLWCSFCRGRGRSERESRCHYCDGTGKLEYYPDVARLMRQIEKFLKSRGWRWAVTEFRRGNASIDTATIGRLSLKAPNYAKAQIRKIEEKARAAK
jgi:RecJ-like exonuclease